MDLHDAKRVEIIIEAPLERRLTEAMHAADVTGYTVLPVLGGSGESGAWSREGQVSRASGIVSVVCLVSPEQLDTLLEAIIPVVGSHIGAVSITDAKVLGASGV
ncbi:MAG: transcriptional regulator [Boseongicola sp.]|jgi:nitrogen regulatory protein PII|nr:transcriptional regulator [Boseongicola sp.]